MSKTIGIAALKAHLSAHVRRVRRGESIIVLDHGLPVAELGPIRTAPPANLPAITPATRKFSDVVLPAAPRRKPSSEGYLAAERDDRR